MINLLLTKILGSKNWHTDDHPQLFRGIVEDPHVLATWEEVEHCINFPQFYDIKFIHRDTLEYIQIPKHQRCWAHDSQDVRDLMQAWVDGHNIIINNFDSGFKKKQEILKQFEEYFDARMALHVYAGYTGCSSFRVHEDTSNNFIMQIEGETQWTVYKNRCAEIVKDFTINDKPDIIDSLEIAIDTVLKPGDVIYIPPRTYHRAQPHGKRLSVSIPIQHGIEHMKPKDRNWYKL